MQRCNIQRRNRRQQGFTLIEMLAAITIFALITVSAWQILQGVMGARDSARDHDRRLQTVEYAMLLLEQDFRQFIDRGVRVDGYVSQQSLFAGPDMLDSDDEAAAFIRLGWRNPGQRLPRSQLQNVRYRLYDGVLERQHFHVLEAVEGTEPVTRPLLTGVRSLKFEYFQNGDWTDALAEGVPQGIAILMELDSLGFIERRFMLVESWSAEAVSGEEDPA